MRKKIRELCKVRLGHSFRSRIINEPEGITGVILPRNITQDGRLDFETTGIVRTNIEPQHPLKNGDVVFVNKGRFSAAVFEGDELCTVPSSVLVLSVIDEQVLPEYLAIYINSDVGQKSLGKMVECSTVPFLSRQNLMQWQVPIPELPKQSTLVALDNAMRQIRQKQSRKNELLIHLLNSELE